MAHSGMLTRENSMGNMSGRTIGASVRSESKGYSRHSSSMRVEQDPDVESGRWSFMDQMAMIPRSSELGPERKSNMSRFGSKRSQLSQSPLDMLAAGLDIACLPFFDLTVRNLDYKVTVKTKEQGTIQKTLLNNVSAEAYHGQILAVVGPSGSGKTTFLDAIAGRISKKSLQGEILVNGEPTNESFNRISGYVMQDDALFPHLTVRETLMYSARLRIPGHLSLTEKRNRVENMIITLGLKQCADTRVGNEIVRGVSGGEKRRVSIGADLIHDPAVLFLDEPTSGLDSTSALSVMQKLARMAQSGRRTVVLTIHQPSYRILDTIERVLVLGSGNVIFHGVHSQLKDHFCALGRTMPEFVNVIEYALDTIEDYQRSSEGLQPLINLELSHKNNQSDLEVLIEIDQQSGVSEVPPQYATSLWSECWVLSGRNFKNICRTPELFLSRTGMMVVVALTLGTLFLHAKVGKLEGITQRTAYLSFTLALIMFTSTESIGPFLEERQIFVRETSRGAYRAGPYVLSGAVVILPFLFFLALLYSTVSYWLVGLVAEASAFIFFSFILFLSLCSANSFVIFFSGLVPNFTIGLSLVCGSIAYFFLFSGFFIDRKSIPDYWLWMHYMSLFKYPFEALLQNEFGRLNNVVWEGAVTSHDIVEKLAPGKIHQWINIMAILIQFTGYRILFWLTLKYFSKSIRK
ncbi:unnamed protein product [Calypogeia fissa]